MSYQPLLFTPPISLFHPSFSIIQLIKDNVQVDPFDLVKEVFKISAPELWSTTFRYKTF